MYLYLTQRTEGNKYQVSTVMNMKVKGIDINIQVFFF